MALLWSGQTMLGNCYVGRKVWISMLFFVLNNRGKIWNGNNNHI